MNVEEVFVRGTYKDPLGRQGIVAEGREDNNRAILSTALCGDAPGGNLDPQILSTPVLTAIHGQLYQYPVIATDLDGDPLTYGLSASPSGMTIDGTTGVIQWIGQPFQTGEFPVTIDVQDGQGGSTTQSYTVRGRPTNLPPMITSTPITTGNLNALYQYDVAGTDPESSSLSFSLPNAPEGMFIDSQLGQIRWRPLDPVQVGSHPVVVQITDEGGATDQQQFMLEIVSNISGSDLFISSVNNLPTVTDTQALDLSGQVEVTYGNGGLEHVTTSFDLILFADQNESGTYEENEDVLLGSITQAGGLNAGSFTTMLITVSGTVDFRDDLIFAMVDSQNVVSREQ